MKKILSAMVNLAVLLIAALGGAASSDNADCGLDLKRCQEALQTTEDRCHEQQVENTREFTLTLFKKREELDAKNKEISTLTAELATQQKLLADCRAALTTAEKKLAVKEPPAQSATIRETEAPNSKLHSDQDREGKRAATRQYREYGEEPHSAADKLPAAQAAAKHVTLLAEANVRQGPGRQFPIVGQVLKGDSLPLLSTTKSGWLQVELDDGSQGYVGGNTAQTGDEAKAFGQKTGDKVTLSRRLHVRSGPGLHHASLFVGAPGETFTLTGQTANWFKVGLADGREGWLHRNVLKGVGK